MKVIFKSKFGSHVYGTNTPSSDTDYKGVFIPSPRDIILQKAPRAIQTSTGNSNSKNTSVDVDEGLYSLQYFLKQLCEGQTYALDMVFTPKELWVVSSPEWEKVLANRHKFLSRNVTSFAGYCQKQAAKYSLKGSNLAAFRLVCDFFVKYPTHQKITTVLESFKSEVLAVANRETIFHDKAESIIKLINLPHKVTKADEWYIQVGPKTKVPVTASCGVAYEIYKKQFDMFGDRAKLAESNEGVDYKALSHAVRVCREAEELLLTGNITFPIIDPLVMQIKQGLLPFRQITELIEDGLARVMDAKTKTVLPAEPDLALVDDLVYEIYLDIVLWSAKLGFNR